VTTTAIRPAPLAGRSDWVPLAGAVTAMVMLVLGGNLAGNGILGAQSIGAGVVPGWEYGSLLRVLLVWMAGWIAPGVDHGTALVLLHAFIAALGGASFVRLLRVSNWPTWQALLALVLVTAHPVVIQAVTLTSPEFLLAIAAYMLIPARRRLEAIGDVQAVVGYGLVLIALLLSGPALAALIPLLILAVPVSDREGRGNPGIFSALLLVAITPVLIVVLGVWSMWARAGLGMDLLAAPFVAAFRPSAGDPTNALLLMLVAAPVALAVLLHVVIPDRRRQVFTSLLVVVLPLYLALGNAWLGFGLAPWGPGLVLLAATMGWLGATRIRPWMRYLVLALLLMGTAASWWLGPFWSDPGWLDALMPIQLFGYRFG
jgi:hypothetical protein